MTARYLAGRIEYPDLPGVPVSTFEIWDENPDILVRGRVAGQLVSELSVRGQRLVATDFASAYTRIDEGGDPALFRERALGMFKVPAETLALLTPVGKALDPEGLAYVGNFDGQVVRLIIDETTGLLAGASGGGQPAIRITYERNEIVASVPPLTVLPKDIKRERYDLNPATTLAAFGLTVIPHVPGFAPDHTLTFTTLGGGTMAEIGYTDPSGTELVARWIAEIISTTTAHGIKNVDGVWRARLRETGAYVELEGPTETALRALAGVLRPGLAL